MMQLDTDRGDDWEDEVRTTKTAYLVQLIMDGYIFKKEIWPGGDSSLPLHIYKPKNPSKVKRTVLRKKKSNNGKTKDLLSLSKWRSQSKKYSSNRRQQKLEEFLSASQTSNDELRSQFQQFVASTTLTIKELQNRVEKLKRCSRSRKSIVVGKFSSQRVRMSCWKKKTGRNTLSISTAISSQSTKGSIKPVSIEPVGDEAVGNDAVHEDWERYSPAHRIVSDINLQEDEGCSHNIGQHSENSNEGRGIPSDIFDEADNATPMVVDETDVIDTLPRYGAECVMVSTQDGKIFVENHTKNSAVLMENLVDPVNGFALVDVAPGVDTMTEAEEAPPIVSDNSTKDDGCQKEKNTIAGKVDGVSKDAVHCEKVEDVCLFSVLAETVEPHKYIKTAEGKELAIQDKIVRKEDVVMEDAVRGAYIKHDIRKSGTQ
ncbi:unnamed protein product [Arabis nemorensis]|uniref:Uncharacterized protein n=1 Tax=Arabis nemorensis TaxID=586526 RepID=A0A565BJ01_9BRAS|nr:unnamed protein product [Arabis nemorensis]